jgi:hypothetical protein
LHCTGIKMPPQGLADYSTSQTSGQPTLLLLKRSGYPAIWVHFGLVVLFNTSINTPPALYSGDQDRTR